MTTYAYCIVRNDLSGGALLLYAFHAGRECLGSSPSSDERACVLVATKAQLDAVRAKLLEHGVAFKAFEETDGQMAGSVPVVSFSFPLEQKQQLSELLGLRALKPWSEKARAAAASLPAPAPLAAAPDAL